MRTTFFLALFLSLGFTSHKFYVSNTLMHHDSQSQIFEITMKVFTGDLERALEEEHGTRIRLGDDEHEHASAEDWIADYLIEKFQVSIDDKQCDVHFVGKEVDYDMTYCYLEIINIIDFHSILVRNDILYECFPEQENIVDIDFQGWKQRILLEKNHPVKRVIR